MGAMPELPGPRSPRWWPSGPSSFTDTTVCPACFTPLGGTLCRTCGLDLDVPEATSLLAAGSAVAAAEAERQNLIARMRSAQDHRPQVRWEQESLVRQAASTPVAPVPHRAPAPTSTHTSSPPPSYAPADPVPPMFLPAGPGTPPPPAGDTGPARSRRSGIQILMLTVGVILVSIMALFFVLLAYLVASLEVRSVLTGLASVAVFGVAVVLSRRRLFSTAEGITALAVVLFLLDIWIIRANGLFGSADIDGWLYIGIATGLLTGLLVLATRVVPLRTLSLSAVLIGPFAVFALVQGLLAEVDPWTRGWTALTVVGLGALVWPRVGLSAERAILRISGLVATVLAAFCAFGVLPDVAAGASIALAVTAGVWLLTLVVASAARTAQTTAPGRLDAWDVLAAVGLGLAASGAGLSLFTRADVEEYVFWLPSAVTALSALLVASLTRIPALAQAIPALRLAVWFPLGFAAVSSLPALASAAIASAWGLTTRPFSLSAFGGPPPTRVPLEFDAPVAVILVSALGLAALATLGVARRTAWMPAGYGGIGLVCAGAVLGQPVASSVFLGVLAVVLLVAIALLPFRSLRVALGCVFAVAVGVFATIGVTSTATFPVTTVATLLLLGAARQVIARTSSPAAAAALTPVATGSAAIVLILGARLVPTWFDSVTGTAASAAAPALWMTLTALLLGVGILVAVDILTRAELAAVAGVVALATGAGLAELTAHGNVPALLTALAAASVVGLAWQLRRRVASWPERVVAAAVPPVTTVWAVGLAWSEFGPAAASGPATATDVVMAAAVLLLAAAGPVLFRRGGGRHGTHPSRLAWDGALGVSAIALVADVAIHPELGWLTLVLLAVAALLVASGDGDIVSGSSPRRHVAWLGLPLAVAGLWLGLARADATVIEFYSLPVAALLLAILGITLARRPPRRIDVETGRTALLIGALVVGLGPSAIVATGATPLRAVLVLTVAAGLVVAGTLLVPVQRGLAVGLPLWTAGAGAAAITGLGRALNTPDGAVLPFEWWAVAGSAILLGAAVLWHRWSRSPSGAATVAAAASVVVLALPTVVVLLGTGLDAWRAVLVLVVTCGIVATASVRDEFSPVLGWVSIVAAAVLSGALLVTGTADPFELATAPLAAALLIGGSMRLVRDQGSRSWPALGPGLALLLLPSLAADFWFSNDLWRVVALGVASLAVLGIGLALRLQAPTLLGAVVVVLHGLAQLWPWISGLYGSVPWWLWAGIGGVVLIVFATTYESRIRDLKAVARGVSSLR